MKNPKSLQNLPPQKSKTEVAGKNEKPKLQTRLTDDAWKQAAECLKVLAHPIRLQMVQLLLDGKYSVGEIAEYCDIAPNIASEHLRLMQRCGFLESTKEVRSVFYHVVEPQLENIMNCIVKRFGADSE